MWRVKLPTAIAAAIMADVGAFAYADASAHMLALASLAALVDQCSKLTRLSLARVSSFVGAGAVESLRDLTQLHELIVDNCFASSVQRRRCVGERADRGVRHVDGMTSLSVDCALCPMRRRGTWSALTSLRKLSLSNCVASKDASASLSDRLRATR